MSERELGILTKQQAAALINVSVPTLERYMRKKEIPHYKRGLGPKARVYFKRRELMDWFESFRVEIA